MSTAERWLMRLEHAAFDVLLHAWPAGLRQQYGAEMRATFADMQRDAQRDGMLARPGLWMRVWLDAVRSAPVERWRERRARRCRMLRDVPSPDWSGAALAGIGVLLLYWLTLAPTTAFWDAGEYITVAHVSGIPHPPGNPLFVMFGRFWDLLLAPFFDVVAVRINLLSAVCSAVAHALLFLAVERSLRPAVRAMRRVAAGCAVLMSASAFTVWHQSNVNEKVYTISFLTTMLVLWLALRWRDTRNPRLLILAAYITALSATNHLMGVLVAPAILLFAWRVDRGVLRMPKVWAAAVPAMLLALSAQLFLPIRAAERPVVNEPDPVCGSLGSAVVSIYSNGAAGCDALSATLTREQYQKPSVLTDPNFPDSPRGAALIASQFVNYLQYLDWQWARSVAGRDPLFGGARPMITLLVILLIAIGVRTHWRHDRDAALLHGSALLMLSFVLVLYLNFRWGFTINRDAFPDPGMHEVRERDYFFLVGFSLWGAWAGLGIAALWRIVGALLPRPRLLAAPVLALALVPLALNWSWAGRQDDWTARDWAYNVLMSVEPYGVLVTNGDNDSFPLWYLQHVENVREDVTIVLSPYLSIPSYVRQVRDMSRPCGPDIDPLRDRTVITCQRPLERDSVHPRLLAVWGGVPDRPPEDSILPYDDGAIGDMAQSWFVAQEDMELHAGTLVSRIAEGTTLTPVDTFVAAIVRSSWGKRPIHFMSPSVAVARLGLGEHTVRAGLTWKLREPDDGDVIPMAPEEMGTIGAYLDLALTDTLARDVFIVRGRVADPEMPWVDHANYSIPLQYSLMHLAAARGWAMMNEAAGAEWHARRLDLWNSL